MALLLEILFLNLTRLGLWVLLVETHLLKMPDGTSKMVAFIMLSGFYSILLYFESKSITLRKEFTVISNMYMGLLLLLLMYNANEKRFIFPNDFNSCCRIAVIFLVFMILERLALLLKYRIKTVTKRARQKGFNFTEIIKDWVNSVKGWLKLKP